MDKIKLQQVKKLRKPKGYSKNAYNNLIELVDIALKNNGFKWFRDSLWEKVENEFCLDDAWVYMRKYGDCDLRDAVEEGFDTIDQIASYNLEQEINNLMSEFNLEDFHFNR